MLENILRPEINTVFTPRSPEVNDKMYIHRPELEKILTRALTGSMHPFIYGDSGSGKSWLYKRVLDRNGWSEFVANCANADRIGSLTQEIFNVCVEVNSLSLKGIAESKKAKLSAIAVEGELDTTRTYDTAAKEPLLMAFESLAKRAKHGKPILVMDNLESVFSNPKLMDELADIITVTDDARYAKTGIKLIIVGTPSGVIEYFARTKNRATVANRLRELPRVGNLSSSQVKLFVQKGFKDLLRAKLADALLDSWALHISRVTLGIPQRLHEYCEELAYVVSEANWEATYEHVFEADQKWLRTGLNQSYVTIETQMNDRQTKIGRRNQVLYALSQLETARFSVTQIEDIVREEFPTSTNGKHLGIGTILRELSSADDHIIKEAPKISEYEFADPKHRMTLRVMLAKDAITGQVIKRSIEG